MTNSTLKIAASLVVWLKSPRRPLARALVLALAVLVLASLGATRQLASADTTTDGSWSDPVPWPIVAVHMSLEPTGQVLALDGFDDGANSERLWDPADGRVHARPYGRNLFCSGHVQLADGRTLIVGGHISAYDGLADTTLFNPATRTYFRGADMSVGRWYPTATQLPDGRVLVFAGDNIVQDRPGPRRRSPMRRSTRCRGLRPEDEYLDRPAAARLTSPLYPFLFVLSDGNSSTPAPTRRRGS